MKLSVQENNYIGTCLDKRIFCKKVIELYLFPPPISTTLPLSFSLIKNKSTELKNKKPLRSLW